LKETLAWMKRTSGPDSEQTIIANNNLASLYKSQGAVAKSEAMYCQSLLACERTLDSDRKLTLNTVSLLADLFISTHRLAEAEAMYLRAISGFEQTLGPQHVKTLAATASMAMCRRTLAGYQTIGVLHPLTQSAAFPIAILYAIEALATVLRVIFLAIWTVCRSIYFAALLGVAIMRWPPVAISGGPLLIVVVLKQIAPAVVEKYHAYMYSFLVVVFIIAAPFNREF
jgi:hypothetical protein